MRDPKTAKKYGKAQEIRRSASMNKFNINSNLSPQKINPFYIDERVGHSGLGDVLFQKPFSRRTSKRGSNDESDEGFHHSVTQTDYDLEYLEEIELEKAFNVFSKSI